ncbi:MAG: outer membrane autotransporter protein [Methylophagaceae bacterium]|jgi:outer membrane autotransporter protein
MWLYRTTSSVHNLISQRMRYSVPLKPVQVAALELSPGINFGYEWDVNQTRVGLMGGIARAKTDTQTASFQTETDSYYVGAYSNVKLGMLNLTTSLLGGYSDSDNDRVVIDNINGYQVARSDVSSTFISPSVTLGAAYKAADRVELRPSVSVNYSMAWMDDYKETGTTSSNLTVDDRTVAVLTARAQLAAALQLNDATEFEFRAGVSTRNSNSDDVDASIGGKAFSYTNAGDENIAGRFAGVNLRIAAQDNLNLVVDMEFGGDSDENYVNGQMGLDYVF